MLTAGPARLPADLGRAGGGHTKGRAATRPSAPSSFTR